MRVAILGCGPAGLMGAHAAVELGYHVDIFSKKRKSFMFGAQYLHQFIPGVTNPVFQADINYRLTGDIESYRRKVYGDRWDGTVSPEDLLGVHTGWDIRDTYDTLWDMYSPLVSDVNVDPAGLAALRDMEYDVVFNSIPRDALCSRQHHFQSTSIIAAGDAPELGVDVGKAYRCDPFTVMCNGDDSPSWYRLSNVYGYTTVEWPATVELVPIPSAQIVRKPLQTNCDCNSEWIHHIGRYGKWEKGILSHEAYWDVRSLLS